EFLRLHADGGRLAPTLDRDPDQYLLEAVAGRPRRGLGDEGRDPLLVRLRLPGFEGAGPEARLTPEHPRNGFRAPVASQGADSRGQEVAVGWTGDRLRLLGKGGSCNAQRHEQRGHDDLGLTPHGSSAVESGSVAANRALPPIPLLTGYLAALR